MRLSELLRFEDIAVQCHNNPDADTIAAGFTVCEYLRRNGKEPLLFYWGEPIRKANMTLMIKELGIPVQCLEKLPHRPELLLTVDCTYGQSNVKMFEADNIAVIDHHRVSEGKLPPLSTVSANYGGCSSLLHRMLEEEGFDINEDRRIATALYYGLYMDTNGFAELRRPFDDDLRETAVYDEELIRRLKNANLSSEEMQIAGDALKNCRYNNEYRFAIVRTEKCDPNILGFISDLVIQVDTVDNCVVFCENQAGQKISVRSCRSDTRAPELANFITVGNGGGHAQKAGGSISDTLIGERDPLEYINDKMLSYFRDTRIMHAGAEHADTSGMKKYLKNNNVLGYIPSTEISPEGTEILIRMLEADITVKAQPDIYIVVGISGEVYPVKRELFESRYNICDDPPEKGYEYSPAIVDKKRKVSRPLSEMIRGCRASASSKIMARPLTGYTKVFTEWNKHGYMFGAPGDYLAARLNDDTDFYIVKKSIFSRLYSEIE